jgi:hypothetical protein
VGRNRAARVSALDAETCVEQMGSREMFVAGVLGVRDWHRGGSRSPDSEQNSALACPVLAPNAPACFFQNFADHAGSFRGDYEGDCSSTSSHHKRRNDSDT